MRKLIMLAVAVMALAIPGVASAAPPLPGAVFTTDVDCNGVNVNIFDNKDDVYVNGGPAHPGAASLPEGDYYVQVTEPDGDVLGTSVGAANPTPFHVTAEGVADCDKLSEILIKTSDGLAGYDDTTNGGGEYKMWVSTVSTFDNNSTKTDNFKVEATNGGGGGNEADLHVRKYYDADTDGVKDPTEVYLDGWRFNIKDGISFDRDTPVDMTVFAPDTYFVTEQKPAENNWINTDPYDPAAFINPLSLPTKSIELAVNDDETLEFGNVCLGAGGGLTLGFWSNKNGQALIDADDLAALRALTLVDGAGAAFDPTTAAQAKTFLLNGNAVNMAYMLSVQLTAMKLNVLNGKVGGSSKVWDGSAFVSITDLITASTSALGDDNITLANDPNRALQESLKNTLDAANNNVNFVQAQSCSYTFAPLAAPVL
jgi:hypothetical protein